MSLFPTGLRYEWKRRADLMDLPFTEQQERQIRIIFNGLKDLLKSKNGYCKDLTLEINDLKQMLYSFVKPLENDVCDIETLIKLLLCFNYIKINENGTYRLDFSFFGNIKQDVYQEADMCYFN